MMMPPTDIAINRMIRSRLKILGGIIILTGSRSRPDGAAVSLTHGFRVSRLRRQLTFQSPLLIRVMIALLTTVVAFDNMEIQRFSSFLADIGIAELDIGPAPRSGLNNIVASLTIILTNRIISANASSDRENRVGSR